MGGSTIPLPISLSSSSIASSNVNMITGLNHKFLNTRFASNAELIANSLCSSNNNSNANIKVDEELVRDIAMSKQSNIKKEGEDLMEVDNNNNIMTEDTTVNDLSIKENKKEDTTVEKSENFMTTSNDFLNFGNSTTENPDDLDLDF